MVARFADCSGIEVMPNTTVSPTPGKGDYLSLSDAVKNIPSNAAGRYVIYVKAGIYNENVLISRSSVSLVGDGIGRTIIRSSRSRRGTGHTIQDSGAVTVVADKFHARCITFENVSGAENEQAVALRSQGDQSVFYRCEFLGHQDTLYVNGSTNKDPFGRNIVIGRQFFRECDIYGTIDFIFGEAQMVLQKCNIKFRTPRAGGGNVITAQGRMDKNSNTGIVLHCCSITAAGDFKVGSRKGYLGRTWQKYSRTIVMNSFIDDVVDPAGWLEMNGNAQTADYTEYNNSGPGSSTTNRVRWPGYKATKNPKDAMPYTVENFIDGSSWLPATNVPFNLSLSCSS